MRDERAADERASRGADVRAWALSMIRRQARNLSLLVAVGIAVAIVAGQRPSYLNYSNLLVVGLQMSFIAIAALGMTMLIISGYIDLSIGSMFGLAAVVAAIAARDGWPAPLAIVVAIALAGAIGLANGAVVWRISISPIIVTLGSLTLIRGVVYLLTQGFAVTGVPASFGGFGQAKPLGVQMPLLIFVILAPIAAFVLTRSTAGRYIFAIGGNREASQALGLPVRRLVLGAFALNGLLVGLSATLAASRFEGADPNFGLNMELDVITAVILGGVAFTGGEGGVGGVVLAVMLLGVINSGIISIGIDPFYANIVKGAVLVIAVAIDQLVLEQRERYRRTMAMRDTREEEETAGEAIAEGLAVAPAAKLRPMKGGG
jgi:ribose/xylose/arabinose/galactoside ABC-type transport system permease subunit